jgi:hypothetical protein
LAHRTSPSREPVAVIAALVPAIHEPDKASFGGEEGVDDPVEPGDDDYALGLLPNLPQYFVIVQAGACNDHPQMAP